MAKKNSNNWKKRKGVVYSTNEDFDYQYEGQENATGEASTRQDLRIWLDRRSGNKVVTLVKGFEGTTLELQMLGKVLKNACGSGGSVKEGEILIQGDHREKVKATLQKEGHQVKLAGG